MVEQWARLIARWDEEEFDRRERKGRKAVAPRSYEGHEALKIITFNFLFRTLRDLLRGEIAVSESSLSIAEIFLESRDHEVCQSLVMTLDVAVVR